MDIPVLVAGLRPGVVPVLLSGELPAPEVIARTLHDYVSLDTIYIVAHGRPGELSFSAAHSRWPALINTRLILLQLETH